MSNKICQTCNGTGYVSSTCLDKVECSVSSTSKNTLKTTITRSKTRQSRCAVQLLECFDKNNTYEAGIDEVARGCLFGPVYAAAVILDPAIKLHEWLNDSKKVTPRRRAVVRKWIEEHALSWAVASVSQTEIDTINIRNSAMKAMNKAICSLHITPNLLLIDGDYFKSQKENEDIPFHTIIGGDAKYASIAAASILAKEHHDEFIRSLIETEPDLHEKYDVGNNVGYHSFKHSNGLKQWGPSKYHRMSFLKRLLHTPSTHASILFEPDSNDESDDKGTSDDNGNGNGDGNGDDGNGDGNGDGKR